MVVGSAYAEHLMSIGPSIALMPCPACGHQLSTHAASCPQCGHPMATHAAAHSGLDYSHHVGKLVLITLSVLTLGGQATFLTVTRAGSVDEAGAASVMRVFLQTAPLTVALTLITLAIIRKWWDEASSLLFFAGVMLLASLFLGSWFGGLGNVSSVQGNLGTVLFRSMAFYWRHYGARLFVSSLILGPFLAFNLSRQWDRMNPLISTRAKATTP
jgi:hypothetical protein